jgi:hypothetical protein
MNRSDIGRVQQQATRTAMPGTTRQANAAAPIGSRGAQYRAAELQRGTPPTAAPPPTPTMTTMKRKSLSLIGMNRPTMTILMTTLCPAATTAKTTTTLSRRARRQRKLREPLAACTRMAASIRWNARYGLDS